MGPVVKVAGPLGEGGGQGLKSIVRADVERVQNVYVVRKMK
jgi:hypothetical protein